MELNFLKELENNLKEMKENNHISEFMTELSDYLKDVRDNKKDESKIEENKQEDCIYQVVDFSADGVYLQNTNNNEIFEEKNISKELMDIISNDYILRYKDGKYIYDEELTENFLNSMVSIKEYKQIQDKFIKESNILAINPKTKFNVMCREKDYTVLKYENKSMKVPNVLLPYFINEKSVLYFKDRKFHKDLSK